ncbi:hypothetical protein [Kumtagia ephedrae]|jgi:hypothetical protein|uniref:Uncharacterized protein n=1 Tax=Kumtagia ephedrae TaxID=2116701 RepID=A0A2P7SJ55_9HYPH|nr:hypothetical protein [Mesorhizobium ephedrae]PSJ62532.1 hypothetical protein C7I84_07955 [Mesorhizobium ephedrae]
MNELLRKAVEAVQRLPDADQEEVARMMLTVAESDAVEDIDAAHLPDVLEGLAQMRHGEFASDAGIAATFRRFAS